MDRPIMDKKLANYFKEMQIILDNHLTALDGKIFEKNIRRMLFENRQASENLRTALSGCPSRVRREFNLEAKSVLKKSKSLSQLLKQRKEEIESMSRQSAKGKRVLNGYCCGCRRTNHFMNTTG